jgi:hypothetical protein
MTAAGFSPSALTLAALSAPLSVNGSVVAYGGAPPPLTPPHKGEGGSDAAVSVKVTDPGAMWHCPKFPSPLWGGVRGGGAAPCKIALYTEEDAGRRGRLSYPIPRSITSIQFFQAIFSIRSLP